jgi:hypothetical protein
MENLSDQDKSADGNLRKTNSIWGILSLLIFKTNDITDRRFLSGLWGIGTTVRTCMIYVCMCVNIMLLVN